MLSHQLLIPKSQQGGPFGNRMFGIGVIVVSSCELEGIPLSCFRAAQRHFSKLVGVTVFLCVCVALVKLLLLLLQLFVRGANHTTHVIAGGDWVGQLVANRELGIVQPSSSVFVALVISNDRRMGRPFATALHHVFDFRLQQVVEFFRVVPQDTRFVIELFVDFVHHNAWVKRDLLGLLFGYTRHGCTGCY